MSERNKNAVQLACFVGLILSKAVYAVDVGAQEFAIGDVACAIAAVHFGIKALRQQTRSSRRFFVFIKSATILFSAEMAYYAGTNVIRSIWLGCTAFSAMIFYNTLRAEGTEIWRDISWGPRNIILTALAAAALATGVWLAISGG